MTEGTPAVPGPAGSGGTPVCVSCGAAGPEPAPLTWSAGVERGRRVWTCDACARRHLRSIEGKLDTDWW